MTDFNTPTSQSLQIPQPARDNRNRSAAQRRYRKKEEDGFLQLREALREVAKDGPRTRQEILRRASRELRRLAEENYLLSQQKALDEFPRGSYNHEHPQSPSCCSVIHEDPAEWRSYGRTDMARHCAPDTTMSPNTTHMLTEQNYEWFSQLYDANMGQDSSHSNCSWASQPNSDFARRPHSVGDYYPRCANYEHRE
ncbi:uncharacterized protein EDB93DRAFT_1102738 [Suillus bovinus]|uniref:uncharacterized protein n=1 Tax=Suillus bovinus TaxID=48563 RepID=UPI001B87DB61|nr:uncharacterized protein EDB93DRAFT_1102738 [Suillus bovinus]KAG2153616.1 hypothetical protein EDB93DRAFT_1102738 [Suillus bovinus]